MGMAQFRGSSDPELERGALRYHLCRRDRRKRHGILPGAVTHSSSSHAYFVNGELITTPGFAPKKCGLASI